MEIFSATAKVNNNSNNETKVKEIVLENTPKIKTITKEKKKY